MTPGRPGAVGSGPVRTYLDHAATTPMAPEAVEAMLPFLAGVFGNPSGGHAESRLARRAVDDARQQVATSFGVDLGDVVFTGSGTESDNLAVVGGWESRSGGDHPPSVLVCAAMEHHAVLTTCRSLARRTGAELREVPTGKDGLVDLEALAEACTSEVGLVSVMAVNNEIGTVQPLQQVSVLVRSGSPHALFHTDAVQSVPWLETTPLATWADLVSISGHKFGGPKGVGALVVAPGVVIGPHILGGGQERDRRSGTHNVAGIVATAEALTDHRGGASDHGGQGGHPSGPAGRRDPGHGVRFGRDRGPQGQGGRIAASPLRRHRGRGAGGPARPAGRGRIGRGGVLERCRRGEPRARLDGPATRGGGQRHPVLARGNQP